MKRILKLMILLVCLFITCDKVDALSEDGLNYKKYEVLENYISKKQIDLMSDETIDILLTNDIQSLDTVLVVTTYYSNNITLPEIVKREVIYDYSASDLENDCECELVARIQGTCETEYKVLTLSVFKDGNEINFLMINEWKKMPVYKSFDVIALRWTGGFSLTNYAGNQDTNGNSGNIDYTRTSSNFKTASSGIGLSQNLVDSATEIYQDMLAVGTCTTGGTVYGTYQHAQANITLATSKSYTFHQNGMGGVLNFTGNAVGVYDDTPGLHLNYTC